MYGSVLPAFWYSASVASAGSGVIESSGMAGSAAFAAV
jgi:hypothetical protein